MRRLEELGLIDRVVYPEVPLHVEYSLTPLGTDACVPLGALRHWVESNVDRIPVLTIVDDANFGRGARPS